VKPQSGTSEDTSTAVTRSEPWRPFRITRDELGDFLKGILSPPTCRCRGWGYRESRGARSLEKLFQSLPRGGAPERKVAEPPQTGPVLALVHKPGQVQSRSALFCEASGEPIRISGSSACSRTCSAGGFLTLHPAARRLGPCVCRFLRPVLQVAGRTLLGYIGCKGDKTSQALEETVGS